MPRPAPLLLLAFGALAACSKLPKGVDEGALATAVERSIGDPATCVVIADKTGREVWRAGSDRACTTRYGACTTPEKLTTVERAKATAQGGPPVSAGCGSVSWSAGPVGGSGLAYAAVMWGERAYPGVEMTRRLKAIFDEAGF